MKKYLCLGFAILLSICFGFGVLASFNSHSQDLNVYADDKTPTFSVIGEASTEMSPDRAKICASIETLSSDINDAKDKNFQVLNCAVKKLDEMGISKDNIVTTHFSAYPNYDYSSDRSITGYYATTHFTFNVENLNEINDYVSAICECGVTSIKNINYEVSNYQEIYNQTMISALNNAKLKASELTGRDDLQVLEISEEYVYCCSNLYREYSENMIENDLVGKIKITAKLKVELY